MVPVQLVSALRLERLGLVLDLRLVDRTQNSNIRRLEVEDPEESRREGPKPPTYRHLAVEEEAGVLVVRFIDLARAVYSFEDIERLGRELLSLPGRSKRVVLDFEKLDFVPFASFEGKLVHLHRKLVESGGGLRMCNVPPMAIECFLRNKFDKVFRIYSNLEDAVETS
jgi:anti-anti-sigma regulatory factor